jgi:hypothetical protein
VHHRNHHVRQPPDSTPKNASNAGGFSNIPGNIRPHGRQRIAPLQMNGQSSAPPKAPTIAAGPDLGA